MSCYSKDLSFMSHKEETHERHNCGYYCIYEKANGERKKKEEIFKANNPAFDTMERKESGLFKR